MGEVFKSGTPRLAGILVAIPALGLAVPAGAERKEKQPSEIDVSEMKSDFTLLHDGSGHYVVVAPFSEHDDHVFYGDGKTFYKQRLFGGGHNKAARSWNRSFWSPQAGRRGSIHLERGGKEWTVKCGDRKTPLVSVKGKEAKKVLARATFRGELWRRTAYFLARDQRGNYYYVDKRRDKYGGKAFRLYAGPKGKLDRKRMTNIVSDSEGDIFATKSGDLRLTIDKDRQSKAPDPRKAVWVEGDRRKKLKTVPVRRNQHLIYTELGVYRERLGTPCDDL